MEIRFVLDEQFDADLIQIIANRANGASKNKAVYLLLVEWMAVLQALQLSKPPQYTSDVSKISKTLPNLGGYVYLIQADLPDTPCKIGRSNNVPNRLKLFEVKLPFDFELLHTIPCDDTLSAEVFLHETFADKRTNGEWFSLSTNEITDVKQIDRYENGKFILKETDGDSLHP